MSAVLHDRLLAEVEQLRRTILDQRLVLERIDLSVVMLFQELRDRNRPRFYSAAED